MRCHHFMTQLSPEDAITTATASSGITLEIHHLLPVSVPHRSCLEQAGNLAVFLAVTMGYSFHRPNFNDDSFHRPSSV